MSGRTTAVGISAPLQSECAHGRKVTSSGVSAGICRRSRALPNDPAARLDLLEHARVVDRQGRLAGEGLEQLERGARIDDLGDIAGKVALVRVDLNLPMASSLT